LLVDETNVPFDKDTPAAILQIAFVVVELDVIDNKSSQPEIFLYEFGHLLISICVFPSFKADYAVPAGRLVALTNLRVTSAMLFLHPILIPTSDMAVNPQEGRNAMGGDKSESTLSMVKE